jgi:hypothetical protein
VPPPALPQLAATHKLRSTGIDEEFLGTVREQLAPGTSALIVLSSDAREELIRPVLARSEATLIATDLPEDARRRLDDLLAPPPDRRRHTRVPEAHPFRVSRSPCGAPSVSSAQSHA